MRMTMRVALRGCGCSSVTLAKFPLPHPLYPLHQPEPVIPQKAGATFFSYCTRTQSEYKEPIKSIASIKVVDIPRHCTRTVQIALVW
uniref:Putative secreted protein n=1 Tax=Anopheles darlingi TaxID=43151 RepID=A0A2M4DR26_ANODA